MRLDEFICGAQLGEPATQLLTDQIDGADQSILRRDEVRTRIDRAARDLARDRAREGVEHRQGFDRLIEEFHAQRLTVRFSREDVDDIAAHPEGALREIHLVARVLHVGEPAQELPLIKDLAAHEVQHHGEIGLRVTEAINRRHRRDDDRIFTLEQRLRGRQAHLLDVFVDRGVLLDVGIARGDVGLGLVIVVIRDEVLDRVVREELAELTVELGGQRLVVGEDQRRTLYRRDHVGDGEGLAATRDPKQRLVGKTRPQTLFQGFDGSRLVAGGGVVGNEAESVHVSVAL